MPRGLLPAQLGIDARCCLGGRSCGVFWIEIALAGESEDTVKGHVVVLDI
jgi:hypothetical protein